MFSEKGAGKVLFRKKLRDLTFLDIQELINTQQPEGLHLEYKRELNLKADSGKKKFLQAVSAFANSQGGDLVIGIEEHKTTGKGGGKETKLELHPLSGDVGRIDDLNKVIINTIRDSITPNVICEIEAIPTDAEHMFVLIIRIPPSLNAPHMINVNSFFRRNSSGKEPMGYYDVQQAFQMRDGRADRIAEFLDERRRILKGDNFHLNAVGNAISDMFIAFHMVPWFNFHRNESINPFTSATKIALINRFDIVFPGISLDSRPIFEGLFFNELKDFSILIMHNGCIEITKRIPIIQKRTFNLIETGNDALRTIKASLQLYEDIGAFPPFVCSVSFFGLFDSEKGRKRSKAIFKDEGQKHDYTHREDEITLPEVVFSDFPTEYQQIFDILQPSLKLLYNAYGIEKFDG